MSTQPESETPWTDARATPVYDAYDEDDPFQGSGPSGYTVDAKDVRELERVAQQLAEALRRHDYADGPGNFGWHKSAHTALTEYDKLKK